MLKPIRATDRITPSRRAAPGLVQPRLTIGPVDDPYEREAERVAEQVMRMPAPSVQRAPAQIQRAAGNAAPEVTPDIESKIQALRGGGQPLDAGVRSFMEPRFGYDFGSVRVHTGPHAARATSNINALAFTIGNDVVFGAGQYQPESAEGQRLIAHELTHVVQQEGNQGLLQPKRRSRRIAIDAIKHPNLVLYQNHHQHGPFFRSVANRISRHIGGLKLDVASGECPEYAKFGPIAFDTGKDIIDAIELAYVCTGKPVTQVHIVSHSGPGGIFGTGDFLDEFGLYEEDRILAEADRTRGGRTLADLPLDALADNVVFVMHGCATAMLDNGFAEDLLRRIVGTSPKAKVYGHTELGEAGRTTDWKEYSAKNPEGRRRKTNPYHHK